MPEILSDATAFVDQSKKAVVVRNPALVGLDAAIYNSMCYNQQLPQRRL
jgi:hypothetical protein